MREDLQRIYTQTGQIKVMDMALEVAFSGRSWREVCADADEITGVPRSYHRLLCRLPLGDTLNGLVKAALARDGAK